MNPAQDTLERPYIQRNIDATRAAMGINHVTSEPYPASSTLTADAAVGQQRHPGQRPALGPAPDPAHLRQAAGHPLVLPVQHPGGRPLPRWTGWRRRPWWASGRSTTRTCPSTSWVNTTLQYTHGYGMIVSPANTETTVNGDPQFAVGSVPPVSNSGLPTVTQPSVYFGLEQQRLRGGQHQAARDRLPADQRHQHRDPLRRRRRGPALLVLRPGHVRRPLQRPQPAHLEPDHQRLASHVRPGRAGPGVEGRTVPEPRRGSLSGPASAVRSTGSRTRTRRRTTTPTPRTPTPSAVSPRAACRPTSTTCATRSRWSSTPTRAR